MNIEFTSRPLLLQRPLSVVSLALTMYHSWIFSTVLSASVLSALATPLPYGQTLDKRDNNGTGTWFFDGLGACGVWSSNSDSIVAISAQIYGNGENCGQWVRVTNTANGETAFGLMRDKCGSCDPQDLDMSEGLFKKIGDLKTGVLPITWSFMPWGFSPPS